MSKQLPIVIHPKSVLRQAAKEIPVDKINSPKMQELILQMKETLKNTDDGVGLAAPQVGESLRIFLVSEEAEYVNNKKHKSDANIQTHTNDTNGTNKNNKKDWKYYVYINPLVKKLSKSKIEYPEGCLSVPGQFGFVKRSEKITVEAYDEAGKKFIRGASKFYARVIQHELDHLNGVLFIDKVERFIDLSKEEKTMH